MAIIRSYTTIEQSKVLAEILPIESADFHFSANQSPQGYLEKPIWGNPEYADYNAFPCWSTSALLGVLPTMLRIVLAINDFKGKRKEKYVIGSVEHDNYDCFADNPIDACYEMILKLHKLKML